MGDEEGDVNRTMSRLVYLQVCMRTSHLVIKAGLCPSNLRLA